MRCHQRSSAPSSLRDAVHASQIAGLNHRGRFSTVHFDAPGTDLKTWGRTGPSPLVQNERGRTVPKCSTTSGRTGPSPLVQNERGRTVPKCSTTSDRTGPSPSFRVRPPSFKMNEEEPSPTSREQHAKGPAPPCGEPGLDAWSSAGAQASSGLTRVGSTLTPGPIVDETVTFLRYRPFDADGLSRSTSSRAAK